MKENKISDIIKYPGISDMFVRLSLYKSVLLSVLLDLISQAE